MTNQQLNSEHEQWLEWRRQGIGATDACVIMQVSPWKTSRQLWEEKVFGNSVQPENSAMTRGKALEPIARSWFEETMNITVFPKNKVHILHDWVRASLDGIDMEEKILVEIKCPNKEDHLTAVGKKVPEKYWPQVQHQLLVTGLPGMYYCSYNGTQGAIVEVARDDSYIESMFSEEEKFWHMVLNKESPELTEHDFLDMKSNREWQLLEMRWIENNEILGRAEKLDKEIRQSMISLAQQNNAKGTGVKVSKSICQGMLDYKQARIDHPEIDWEYYRKKAGTKWNFRATS